MTQEATFFFRALNEKVKKLRKRLQKGTAYRVITIKCLILMTQSNFQVAWMQIKY